MNDRANSMLRMYAVLRGAGLNHEPARALAAETVARATMGLAHQGIPPEEACTRLGMPDPRQFVSSLGDAGYFQGSEEFVAFALQCVYDLQNPWNLDWDCMQAHLPGDRAPTDDEVAAAAAECERLRSKSQSATSRASVASRSSPARIPDRACVERHLEGRQNLQYEEVRAAWEACLRELG